MRTPLCFIFVARRALLLVALPTLSSLVACGGSGGSGTSGTGEVDGPWKLGAKLPSTPQGHGDPVKGKELLLNGNYMSCGIPWTLWNNPATGATIKQTFGGDGPTLPGREGDNATLPYWLNKFTTVEGAEVVNRNCLTCHGGRFDGEVVIGLGNATADFTGGLTGSAPTTLDDATLTALGLNDAEKASMKKLLRTGAAVNPLTQMRTIGLNPAEQLTGALISHHDEKTLAWTDTPTIPVVVPMDGGAPIPDAKLTSDPPPWWRAHKKNALFYNGMARGDHRGTMALATSVCVDSMEEAQRVDGLFKDMHEYVLSLRPPTYKRHIDAAMAKDGKGVFETTCAGCHGTYAADRNDDDHDTYPNLIIPLDVIGTDRAVAEAPLRNPSLVDWYNGSFYGQVAQAAPSDPFPGYVPPPLDGIWATAPFLHNGSVPNVALMLNSTKRPKYWKRVDLDDTNFDEENLGWPYEEVSYSQADAPADEQKMIYDTTYYSQSNSGHTFGDQLTDQERRNVIEYLKTL